jgi:hypothetical protein
VHGLHVSLHGGIGGSHFSHAVLHQRLDLLQMPELGMALWASPEGIAGLGSLCWASAPVVQSAAASAISRRVLKFNVMRHTLVREEVHAGGRYVGLGPHPVEWQPIARRLARLHFRALLRGELRQV